MSLNTDDGWELNASNASPVGLPKLTHCGFFSDLPVVRYIARGRGAYLLGDVPAAAADGFDVHMKYGLLLSYRKMEAGPNLKSLRAHV